MPVRRRRPALPLLVLVLAACGDGAPVAPAPSPEPAPPGGPLAGLTAEERTRFDRGRAEFSRIFTISTGLGPLVNEPTCGSCHAVPAVGGSGAPIAVHATRERGDGSCDALRELGGPVYQTDLNPLLARELGIASEPIPPGATTAVRTPPDLFGFGLLDAVPDETLLALADPDDADGDGISGRVHRRADGRIGRFGRKGEGPDLALFNEEAFQVEMGISTPGFPTEGTLGGAPIPPEFDPLPEPEIDAERVALADDFVRFLAPPEPLPLDDEGERGRVVFRAILCAECHVPTLETGAHPVAAIARREVVAYTDLLLHDMGDGLADICLEGAGRSEFRTEPLMGLRFSRQFLHDGRASTIEEAISWHDGEAASARIRFGLLDPADRRALLAFLRGL